MRCRFAMLLVSWLLVGWVREASAGAALYSAYEQATIRRELGRRGWQLEPNPEGKLISEIEIVRLDVFDETDPVPDFVNVFHTISKDGVIRRELLFQPGQRFSQRRLDESARNLKSLIQLSLVLFVPVRDPVDGRVRVLVITKDVWSLRLNSDIQLGSEGLTYLLLNPTETNFAGTHASLGAVFVLKRSTFATGLLASHGRIFGSRLAGSLSAVFQFDSATGSAEGSYGSFSYGVPRYSEHQRWYHGVLVNWSMTPIRVAPVLQQPTLILAYDREIFLGSSSVTRSFGLKHKLELGAGAEVDRRYYTSLASSSVDPKIREKFEREDIPTSDMRVSPFIQLMTFENRFLKTIELETLGLQEDHRLGPQTRLKVYPASTKVGSSRDLLGIYSALAYTQKLGDGLARAIAASTIQYANAGQHQGQLSLALRLATPRLGFGRLVLDSVLENRYQNYLNTQSAIGGDGRLRGYPYADTEVAGSVNQRGADVMAINNEFRTAGVDILSAQCGLVAFHDVGGAGDRFEELVWKQSVGVGARVLFPQLDRIVFRFDWAFPLSPGYETFPGAVFMTMGQAFAMPEL